MTEEELIEEYLEINRNLKINIDNIIAALKASKTTLSKLSESFLTKIIEVNNLKEESQQWILILKERKFKMVEWNELFPKRQSVEDLKRLTGTIVLYITN